MGIAISNRIWIALAVAAGLVLLIVVWLAYMLVSHGPYL